MGTSLERVLLARGAVEAAGDGIGRARDTLRGLFGDVNLERQLKYDSSNFVARHLTARSPSDAYSRLASIDALADAARADLAQASELVAGGPQDVATALHAVSVAANEISGAAKVARMFVDRIETSSTESISAKRGLNGFTFRVTNASDDTVAFVPDKRHGPYQATDGTRMIATINERNLAGYGNPEPGVRAFDRATSNFEGNQSVTRAISELAHAQREARAALLTELRSGSTPLAISGFG